jgi:hypothetical protein
MYLAEWLDDLQHAEISLSRPKLAPASLMPQILSRSLVVGQSANILTDTTLPAQMGFALYDGPAGMLNCHFAGFEKPGFQAIRVRARGGHRRLGGGSFRI